MAMPPFFQTVSLEGLKKIRTYGRSLTEVAIRTLLLLIATAVINAAVLYLYVALLHFYRLTYVGRRFVVLHPKTTRTLSGILGNDPVGLAVDVTLTAFALCLLVAAVGQIFYIACYFYHSRNLIGKIAFWGLPPTESVSMEISGAHGFGLEWALTCAIALLPTLYVFTHCFESSARLLPEIGDVIFKICRFSNWMVAMTAQRPDRLKVGKRPG